MRPDSLSRRAFLQDAGLLLGLGPLALSLPALAETARYAEQAFRRRDDFEALTPEEAVELEAIAAQIIPSGETPGAREAGVVYFIDQAMGTVMAGAFGFLRDGLSEFQTTVRAAHPNVASFSALSEASQIAALREAEQTPFFGFMRFLTIAGMFSNPTYGGNRDMAGWHLLGFDHQHAWSPPFGYYDAHQAGEGANR